MCVRQKRKKHLESYKLTPTDGQNNSKASLYEQLSSKIQIVVAVEALGLNSAAILGAIICFQINTNIQ